MRLLMALGWNYGERGVCMDSSSVIFAGAVAGWK